ncbi:MAG: FIVAR domain-containing protein [Clostridiales bacterium]|nr:FIVAR domain-containing protein [Clostridiales bacterium]
MKKTSLTKKIVAAILAVIMVFSALPTVAFAADATGPVQQSSGNLVNETDTGFWVSFKANYQNFTFIQTQDDQNFTFTINMGAKKNNGVNYGYVAAPNAADRPFTFTQPLGKSSSFSGDGIGSLPGNFFGGNTTVFRDLTVNFVGEGGKTYETAIRVQYDSGSTSGSDRAWRTYDIPITVTVLDKRALNKAIDAANAAASDQQYYTEATWGDVVAALANAESVAGNEITTQTIIDRYATALQQAVNALEYKPADYSKLNAAMDAAEAILDTDNADDVYTAQTLADLREAYAAASDVATNLDIRNQSAVDDAAADLQAAVDSMLKFANYSVMQAAVNAFSKLNPAYYDTTEFADVQKEVNAAIEEMKPENKLDETQQADVSARAMALLQKINSLQILPADYETLNKAVEDGLAKLGDENIGNYTETSVKALSDAVTAAQGVEEGLNITHQAEINALAKAVNDAISGLTLKGADYTALDSAITAANAALEKVDIGDYTDDSVNALKAALQTAQELSRELTVNDQKLISDTAYALMQATSGLTLKPADTAALIKLIEARTQEAADAKEDGLYTEASIARLETAIENAQAVVDAGYTIKEQSKVDDAYNALNGVALEKQLANYDALNDAINVAQETLNNAGDEYTDESKEALQKAINDARAVVAAKYDVSQQQLVDDAVKALQAVQLELKDADYSALDEAIQAAEDFLADPENKELYTEDSLQKVQDALDAAKDVDRDLNITEQDRIDSAVADLTESMQVGDGNLEYKDASTGRLKDAITAAKDKLTVDDIADYTDESVAALEEALQEAEDLLASNPDASQQDAVNAAAEKLEGMNLVLKGADYSALEEAVRAASERYVQAVSSGNYTEDSLAKLNAAITAASEVPEGLTIKQQHIIDEAIANLNVELVLKPADTGALSDAISAAEDKLANRDNYTEDSVAALQQAIDEAKELLASDPDVSQADEIQAAIDKINNTELVLKGADYTVLDAQIKAAEDLLAGDTTSFTKDSLAALNAALAEAKAVDRYLTIQDQDDVDAATTALSDALANLQTYTKLESVTIVALNDGDWRDGQLVYHQTPWYKTWTSQTVALGIQVNDGAAVKSVTWAPANWSIDEPEAKIEGATDQETAVVRPTFGVGPRSFWITVTVEDFNGNKATDTVKVRFYNWDWQIK